jgi:hypothetical protein
MGIAYAISKPGAALTGAEQVRGDSYCLAAGRRNFLVDYKFVRDISHHGKSTCFSIATDPDMPSAEVVASALLQLKNNPRLFSGCVRRLSKADDRPTTKLVTTKRTAGIPGVLSAGWLRGIRRLLKRRNFLVAGSRYVPNLLSIQFRSELIHCAGRVFGRTDNAPTLPCTRRDLEFT